MSFQQGLSGLNATSKNLEVIGNNIANANTSAPRSSRAEFADVYATALNGAGTNADRHRRAAWPRCRSSSRRATSRTTENPMDLAINGAGFFQVTRRQQPDRLHPQRPVQDRPRRLHRQQRQPAACMGYPADGTGVIQPGQARSRCSCRPPASTRRPPATCIDSR